MAEIPPRLLIDLRRGAIRVDGKRLRNLIRDTRPWKLLVALAHAHDGYLHREAFFEICPGRDPKAAVCDAFRRLREALTKDGVDFEQLIRRAGHGPWRLVARVTLRNRCPEILGANGALNAAAVSRGRKAEKRGQQ